jgi:hypothetical protein
MERNIAEPKLDTVPDGFRTFVYQKSDDVALRAWDSVPNSRQTLLPALQQEAMQIDAGDARCKMPPRGNRELYRRGTDRRPIFVEVGYRSDRA